MNLYEFEGKALFREYGIDVPESVMLYTDDAPAPLPYPFVLKAQTMTGGRGKAGAIRMCKDEAEYRKNAKEILHMRVKDHPVCGLLCEAPVKATEEYYLSVTLQGVQKPTLIFCPSGGMEIEDVARTAPERIIRLEIDPFTGIKPYQLRYLCAAAPQTDASMLTSFVKKLYSAFVNMQAILVEVNPLGVSEGKLTAMDAKVVLDNHSRSMGERMAAIEKNREKLVHRTVEAKETTTITYVPLDGGNIGLISDGAGTGMLTLDLITELGGSVASFCELGGTTPAEVMYRAMSYTLERKTGIDAVMIVLIGGFNRMDDMANGITGYLRDHNVNVPIFTRMCGTMEEEGKRIMDQAGLKTYDNLTETVRAMIKSLSLEVK